ncbi:MAG TPA: hypothetical protein VHF25_02415, partial [Nitriliruptorales bacterium]|nr:hypothetical protein [Nitriliruptorales bacterium]
GGGQQRACEHAAAGLVMLTQVDGADGLRIVVVGSMVVSLALAPVFTLTTELIVGSAPPERAGTVSGISETGAEFGGALGLAILGSVGTAIYRSAVADGLPAGLSARAGAAVRDTLGGAVAVAADLPDGDGAAVLAVARAAFVDGLQAAAAISAVIAVAGAILVVVALRAVRPRWHGQGTAPGSDVDGLAVAGIDGLVLASAEPVEG